MMRRSSQFMGNERYHGYGRPRNRAATPCDSPAQRPPLAPLSSARFSDAETIMLQLYFSPMACSLASRIALMEAGIEARYHLIDLWKKRVIEGDGDFFAVSPKGA